MRFEIVDEEKWERQLNACARRVQKHKRAQDRRAAGESD